MNQPEPVLAFTQDEINLIGHTADALSAYMGKPVLAEIMDPSETGAEWVAFGIPLDVNDAIDEDAVVVIQLGGPGARFAGNRGGLGLDDDVYACECLWIIQLSEDPEARYMKVDPLNQEYDVSNELRELLPFEVSDDAIALAAEDADSENEDDTDEEDEAAEAKRFDAMLDKLQPPGSGRLH